MLEDAESDAQLEELEMRKAGIAFQSRRVRTKEEFLREVREFAPDAIIADYSLPQFDALAALHLLKEIKCNIPFILVTGTQSEMVAVACMKEGADDYILKSSLRRLPSALLNAVKKKEAQRQQARAEEALRHSEQQYRLIAENTHDLISMLDLDGLYVYASPSHEAILGYAPKELIGSDWFQLVHYDDRERATEKFRRALAEGEEYIYESRCRRKGGEWRVIESVGSWIFDESKKPQSAVVVSRDITERKLLEEQLRRSQKLEAIARLTGGIAHDFNNLLTAISGYSQLALGRIGKDEQAVRDIKEVMRAAESASSLTRQLLAFSRKQMLQPVVLNFNAIVAATEKMLRRLIGEDIELATVIDPDLGHVLADPGHLEQVIMNLAINARDAMPEGGKLTIETSNVFFDESYVAHRVTIKPGPYVMLAMTDTGQGMDKATQSRIFEPFFTTKEHEKGTGLGLSTVHGIIEQSGGHIWVYSEPGHGATFKIYLPRTDAPAVEDLSERGGRDFMPKGAETVLLVEDDSMVRALTARLLRELGYKVAEASNGEEALRLAGERAGEKIDLLMTDMIMPQMSGASLAERINLARPGTKVLFVSGYTDEAIVKHGLLEPGAIFLQKPFTPSSLARKVRHALEGETLRSG